MFPKENDIFLCKKRKFIKDLLFILMFFFIFFPFSTAQNELKSIDKTTDSIFSIVDTIDSKMDKIKFLGTLVGQQRYLGNSRLLIDKAVTISEMDTDPLLLANSYYSLGNYYYYHAELDSSLTFLNRAYEQVLQTDDRMLQSSILTSKGGVYGQLGIIKLAISYTIYSMDIIEKIDTLKLDIEQRTKLKGRRFVLLNSMANLYSKMEDYDTALLYYDAAFKTNLSLDSDANASVILNNKGDLLNQIGRYDEALVVLLESKKLKIKAGLPKAYLATTDLNIGMAYFGLKNTEKAMEYYQASLAINEEEENQKGIMQTITQRGILYFDEGKYVQAKEDCNKAKEIALSINDVEHILKTCNCLYQTENALGNFEESLRNHELLVIFKDSVFNEKNIRKMTQAQMQYDFDRKEEEQERVLAMKNRRNKQVIIALIILAVFSIMLFIFYKKRLTYQKTISTQEKKLQQRAIDDLQQKNKLVAFSSMIEGQEVERLRIAKDLHDSLGGILSTIKNHFSSIQNEIKPIAKPNLIQKTSALIDEACIEVRRISHNMMPHALSISGLAGVLEDLAEQLSAEGYLVTLEIIGDLNSFDDTKKVMIYRLIQEVTSNIKKHAEATSILIQLLVHEVEFQLIIEDDGKGFEYDKAIEKGGLGLKSINSRVAFLDGQIHWDSEPNRGTTISINSKI